MPIGDCIPSFHVLVALCVPHAVAPASLSLHSDFAVLGIGSSQSAYATIRVDASAWQSTRQSCNSSLPCAGSKAHPISSHLCVLTPSLDIPAHPHVCIPLNEIPSPIAQAHFTHSTPKQDHNLPALPIA